MNTMEARYVARFQVGATVRYTDAYQKKFSLTSDGRGEVRALQLRNGMVPIVTVQANGRIAYSILADNIEPVSFTEYRG